MEEKLKRLLELLSGLGSVAVAYSGGVDSTFLLAAARQALGDKTLGVIGRSPTYPKREYEEAIRLAGEIGARVRVVDTCELDNPAYAENPHNRCFACKTELFTRLLAVAAEEHLAWVVEGSNADDLGDYRPGIEAGKKLGVRAPLVEVGFTKDEIRACSREIGLATWNKPAFACLSSRIPYGEAITGEKLFRIEQAEEAVRALGFAGLRVRDHFPVARIEVGRDEIAALAGTGVREMVVSALKALGYRYVCVDLEGYRTGAMNEVLTDAEKGRGRAKER